MIKPSLPRRLALVTERHAQLCNLASRSLQIERHSPPVREGGPLSVDLGYRSNRSVDDWHGLLPLGGARQRSADEVDHELVDAGRAIVAWLAAPADAHPKHLGEPVVRKA